MSDFTRDALLVFVAVAFVINIYLNIFPSSRKKIHDENGFLRDLNDRLVKDNINERELRLKEKENFQNYKAAMEAKVEKLEGIVEFLGNKLGVDVNKIKI